MVANEDQPFFKNINKEFEGCFQNPIKEKK